jgi:hypothetical protein
VRFSDSSGSLISRLRPWQVSLLLGALAALVGVIKYGIGVFPSWIYMYDLSVNWSDPSLSPLMVPPADYLQSNFVAAWLAGLFGFTTVVAHFTFHVVLAVFAIVLPFLMPVVRESVMRSRLVFIAIAGGSALPVLLLWVNGYDAVTLIGLGFAALCRNKYIAVLGWFIATLNHPSIGIVALIAWAGLSLWVNRSVLRVVLAGLGVAAGGVLNGLLMDAWGGSTSRLDWFSQQSFSEYVSGFFSSMPILFFSALGVFWFVLLRPKFFRLGVVRILATEAILLSLLLPWVTLDTSRTVALALFAAVLCVAVALPDLLEPEVVDSSWRNLGIVAAIVPVPVVWSGALLYGGWESFFGLDTALLTPEGYGVLG